MATLSVSLTPEMETLVNERISSGMYESASDVVDDALRMLKEHHQMRRLSLDELTREISVGTEQIAMGDAKVFHSGEELAAHIEAEGRKLVKTRIANG